jgi:hypothetical protein
MIEHGPRRPRPGSTRSVLGAGALAGTAGGALMMLWLVLVTVAAGADAKMMPKAFAGAIYGVEALVGGAGAIGAGLLLHIAVSVLLGVMFAALTPRSGSHAFALLAGGLAGIFLWAASTYVGVPILNPTLEVRILLLPWAWLVAHVLFGLGLALTPGLKRRIARTPAPPPQPGWWTTSINVGRRRAGSGWLPAGDHRSRSSALRRSTRAPHRDRSA